MPRIILDTDPFAERGLEDGWAGGAWPARWISCPGAIHPPFVTAYRCRFHADTASTIRLHVSADERYELFLDGERLGRGPERGDPSHWFFESYDLSIEPGDHVLVARVWSLGVSRWEDEPGLAPIAQMSLLPGFVLAAEGPWEPSLSTGVGPWEAKVLGGHRFRLPGTHAVGHFAGTMEAVEASSFDWGYERGGGEGWSPVAVGRRAGAPNTLAAGHVEQNQGLRPATLPPMLDAPRVGGRVRYAADTPGDAPIREADSETQTVAAWQAMLDGRGAVTVPAGSRLRVIIDLEDYVCAYPRLKAGAGSDSGGTVTVHWSEALYLETPWWHHRKGDRDVIEGKTFAGKGDTFVLDGATHTFDTLWWRAGRYLQFEVDAAGADVTIERFELGETRYPLEDESTFSTDGDSALSQAWPIMRRGLAMCMHETYMDCPYYEQLMYVGDTRLQSLVTMALSRDDRLPRKALLMFDASRGYTGLTRSRYPSSLPQLIPPFSLWWIGMVHDYARWRDDAAFVRDRMVGVRSVIETYLAHRDEDGLIGPVPGWNFLDWVPNWFGGAPPHGQLGVSGALNWNTVLALGYAADLEDGFGEALLAQRNREAAWALAQRVTERFWDESRGLFADDPEHEHWSQHSQLLALLTGLVDDDCASRMIEGLQDESLAQATIYFSHYLLEVYARHGRIEAFYDRLESWRDLVEMGFKTPVEMLEPSRSDCHAWGAHPIHHAYASVLGMRPAAWGFAEVEVRPQLGPLRAASGSMPHPRGAIAASWQREGERLTGSVTLPESVTGRLHVNGETIPLSGGQCVVD